MTAPAHRAVLVALGNDRSGAGPAIAVEASERPQWIESDLWLSKSAILAGATASATSQLSCRLRLRFMAAFTPLIPANRQFYVTTPKLPQSGCMSAAVSGLRDFDEAIAKA